MIELRSDTFTLPTPEMLAAITAAELGDDVYGEDPTVRRLERAAADRLGKEAALLVPSGTMANLCALLAHCPRGSKVLVGDETDIYIYEAGGASVCGGIVYEPIATQPDGRLRLEDLEAAFPVDPEDPQLAPPALLCLENPHNRCGGAVLPLSYLRDVQALARARRIPVHMDGARIFNAAVALGVGADQIAAHADSIQLCLSKGLSAPIGSLVAGTAGFVAAARRIRKMLGGGMRQAGIIAAAGLVALEQMVDRLADDHRNAQRLARGLQNIPGIAVLTDPVPTNIVFFRVTEPRLTWQAFVAAAAGRGLQVAELGHGRIRAVTHRGVTERDVDAAIAIVADVLREPEHR
ncbi:MAG TPA: low-specificity L-threonine aldolase [Kofleriaceae bacterium]|nr:low-specificity L-threonine aldolase [Kofleriaceae bacterium]